MATYLRVVNHTPGINATGVFRNETLHIYFNSAIQPNTVTWETVSVHDERTFSTVGGTLGAVWESGMVKEITFDPNIPFVANSDYNVYIFGKPQSILGLNGEEIENTYSWSFTTGTGLYTESGSGGLPSGTIPVSGTVPVISEIPEGAEDLIASFSVYSTTPKHQQPNVDINLSEIQIVFTGEILTSLSDMSGYVTVEETPVLQ